MPSTTKAGNLHEELDFCGSCAPAKRRERFRIDPFPLNKQKPEERVHNWDEVFQGFEPEVAVLEASRCLECQHAPCTRACPLENPIPEAMFLIAQGQFAEAVLKYWLGMMFALGPGKPVHGSKPNASRTKPLETTVCPRQPGTGSPAVTWRVLVGSKISYR